MTDGATHRAEFSLKEAAALTGTSERALRSEIDRGVVRAGRRRGPKGRHSVRLPEEALLYLEILRGVPFALPRRDRMELYRLVVEGAGADRGWARVGSRLCKGIVTVDAAASRRRLSTRLRAYRRGLSRIVADPAILGGEPVFAGTRIAVRHVGRLAQRGVPEAELSADFPALSAADIEFARIFAGMKPPPGRPRRRLTIRSTPA